MWLPEPVLMFNSGLELLRTFCFHTNVSKSDAVCLYCLQVWTLIVSAQRLSLILRNLDLNKLKSASSQNSKIHVEVWCSLVNTTKMIASLMTKLRPMLARYLVSLINNLYRLVEKSIQFTSVREGWIYKT